MGLADEYARRANWAYNQWVDRSFPERPNQTALGLAVAKREKRGERYKQPTVKGWLDGAIPNSLHAMVALARELGVFPGWLYFGEGSEPAGWNAVAGIVKAPPVRLTKVTGKTGSRIKEG